MIKKSMKAIIENENFIEYCSFYSVDSNEVVNDVNLINHIQENQSNLYGNGSFKSRNLW